MKYLALDIGNVCIKIDPVRCYGKLGFQEVPREVVPLVMALECGKISEDEFWQGFVDLFPQHRKSRAELEAAFDSILIGPVPGMEELISSLPARGIQPVFFSDVSARHMKLVRKIFKAADAVPEGIYSFETGSWKPGEAMFSAFEQRFGKPVLYVDDRKELIASAAERNWNALVFTGAEDLEKALQKL